MAKKTLVENPPESTGPEKKKRGPYKKQECPYCHRHFGNLDNHIRLAHPTEAAADARDKPQEFTKEDLIGVGTKPPQEPKNITYYCTNCRAELRKGETECWKCGETLNWEGIE